MPARKPGCLQCRKRHVRCDSVRPICSTCRMAKDERRCSYVSLDIRPARYVKQMRRQTLDSTSVRDAVSQSPYDIIFSAGRPGVKPVNIPSTGDSPVLSPGLRRGAARDHETQSVVSSDSKLSGGAITDPIEAEVFEYYIRKAGYYLDIVSPERHLSRDAPRLALTDQLLYSACLAYSSHVLYLLGRSDKATEQRFNDNAIQLLIRKLSEDPGTWSKGSVLTTTVLMRVREQFSEIADDGEYHLNGAFSITASAGRTWGLEPVDLETSAFWTYLRMSVRMCFLCEHATKCDPVALVPVLATSSCVAASALAEAALTNRMTYLLARICNACWPLGRQVDQVELLSLRADMNALKERLPPAFDPWCRVDVPHSLYPTVKHLSTWHAIFWQLFHAAAVLLAANFALLSPPPTLASQGQYMEREIVAPTRKLLAVAFSSDEVGLRINAAALVGWCSQFLTRVEEQDAVIFWLQKLSTDAAWPSKTVIGRLRRIWAGQQSHWTADPAQ